MSKRETAIGGGRDNRVDGHKKGGRHKPQHEQLSQTTEELPKTKPGSRGNARAPFQTKNRVAIPATVLPISTPKLIAVFITAEPLFVPVEVPVELVPLGAGVGLGVEEPPPDPPPWTKNGFTDSRRDVVIVTPPWSTPPMQFATPELIAHERLISNCGREAWTTASEGPWTIVAMRKKRKWSAEVSDPFFCDSADRNPHPPTTRRTSLVGVGGDHSLANLPVIGKGAGGMVPVGLPG